MRLSAGTRLGPYEILAPLGAGGMGEVYRAMDTRLGRTVAIKILPEHLASHPSALARFERESKAVAALSHPNILALFDVGTEQGISFAVTELLEGETLHGRLARSKPATALPWRTAVEVGAAVADGLAAAHSRGIIHRDLKPENIFLTSDGRTKILDFGLVRLKSAAGSNDSSAPTQTEAGTIMGTPGYMSPEQVRGDQADAPSDIFSLGCVLYEMLAGRRAFARETAAQTMTAVLETQPPELAVSGKSIPAELGRVVTHCLEKNPQQRFQSARDLAFALRAVTEAGTAATAGVTGGRKRRSRYLWAGAAAAALLAAGLGYMLQPFSKAIDSLAVLPFVNVGDDPNLEYLSDGITENLINSLAQIPKLRVAPRSLVFAYKKQRDVDPRKAGRDLNVRAVLMGRVTQRGDSLNIQTELVDVTEVSQLWGEQYNRKLGDLISVQDEISKTVSEKLRLRAGGDDGKRMVRRSTENPEAHQFYLRGRYLWNRRTAQTLLRAAEYFQRAIEIDPGYALAWAGLADCYGVYSFYGVASPKEAMAKADQAAKKALALDGTLAEAHASVAYAKRTYEWDWPAAEKEFQRAIELNPNYATAHMWYGTTLSAMGRLDEALREDRRAQECDPLSLIINAEIGRALFYAGRTDPAIEQLRKTLDEIDPNFGVAHWYLGLAYEQKGSYREATAEFQKWSEISGGDPAAIGALGHVYAVSGQPDGARKALAQLQELSKRRYVSSFDIAVVHMGLGDKEAALEWLGKAVEERSAWVIWVDPDPRFASLHGDARYRDLLKRIGL